MSAERRQPGQVAKDCESVCRLYGVVAVDVEVWLVAVSGDGEPRDVPKHEEGVDGVDITVAVDVSVDRAAVGGRGADSDNNGERQYCDDGRANGELESV